MAVLLELDGTWGEAVAFNSWLEKEGRVRRNPPNAART